MPQFCTFPVFICVLCIWHGGGNNCSHPKHSYHLSADCASSVLPAYSPVWRDILEFILQCTLTRIRERLDSFSTTAQEQKNQHLDASKQGERDPLPEHRRRGFCSRHLSLRRGQQSFHLVPALTAVGRQPRLQIPKMRLPHAASYASLTSSYWWPDYSHQEASFSRILDCPLPEPR
jgi:hypothetical protein